jgi:hypothetical protein
MLAMNDKTAKRGDLLTGRVPTLKMLQFVAAEIVKRLASPAGDFEMIARCDKFIAYAGEKLNETSLAFAAVPADFRD